MVLASMKRGHFWFGIILIYSLLQVVGCGPVAEKNHEEVLFELLDSSRTGISFQNRLYNQKEFNIFNYRNFYNGGGVAIGDINNDVSSLYVEITDENRSYYKCTICGRKLSRKQRLETHLSCVNGKGEK